MISRCTQASRCCCGPGTVHRGRAASDSCRRAPPVLLVPVLWRVGAETENVSHGARQSAYGHCRGTQEDVRGGGGCASPPTQNAPRHGTVIPSQNTRSSRLVTRHRSPPPAAPLLLGRRLGWPIANRGLGPARVRRWDAPTSLVAGRTPLAAVTARRTGRQARCCTRPLSGRRTRTLMMPTSARSGMRPTRPTVVRSPTIRATWAQVPSVGQCSVCLGPRGGALYRRSQSQARAPAVPCPSQSASH
ncbi:hypothetical protein BC628DRAFT_1196922 [Trametes gibbosa]|nr:hypothetical protein BC628DRAFT_1196922 [Trametes gibbosa]